MYLFFISLIRVRDWKKQTNKAASFSLCLKSEIY